MNNEITINAYNVVNNRVAFAICINLILFSLPNEFPTRVVDAWDNNMKHKS